MNSKLSFRERATLAKIQLSKQSPATLEQMRKQAQWLSENSETKHLKKKA